MTDRVPVSKRLLLLNSASNLVSRGIQLAVLVWLQQYLLRTVSIEEYAIYPVLAGLMVFAPLLTTILTSGLGRYIVEAYAKNDDLRVTQIASTMFPVLLAASLLVLGGGLLLSWFVDRVLTIPPDRVFDARVMMALMMFAFAAELPAAPFITGMYVRQKFVVLNVIQLGIDFVRTVLLFVLLFGVGARVLWVVVASTTAMVLGIPVKVLVSRRLVPALRFRLSAVRWGEARNLLSFGVWRFLAQLAGSIREAADPIILNKLAAPLDQACFYLGHLAFREIQNAAFAVSAPLEPALTALHATGRRDRLARAYLNGGRYALWLSLLAATPLMIYSAEIIRFYAGEGFHSAATVMILMLALFPICYGNSMMPKLAHAMAQVRPWALRAVVIHGANLALTLYLVGSLRMGAIGSALGTLVATAVGWPLLQWPLGWRLARVRFKTWLAATLWPGLLPAVVGSVVWVGLKLWVQPQEWTTLVACGAGGYVAYAATLFLCLTPEDRQQVQALRRRLRGGLREHGSHV